MKKLILAMSIEKAKNEISLYRRSNSSVDSISLISETLNDIKFKDINEKNITDSNLLQQKIKEIKIIEQYYDNFLKYDFKNYEDEFYNLNQTILSHDVFKGYSFFIYGFDSFNIQEFEILNTILLQSEAVNVSFCTDKNYQDIKNLNFLYPVNKTINKILKLCKISNIKILEPIFLGIEKDTKNIELYNLDRNFYRSNKKSCDSDIRNIQIYNALNIYDECEFVARNIRKLIVNNNYRYKDFAVISRNLDDYSEVIEDIFKKYDINFFIDSPEPIYYKNLIRLVMSALDIVNSNFNSEDIFLYLKTGLTNITSDEISIIENYVLLWNINKKQWLNDFKYNPNGFSEIFTQNDKDYLSKINEIRLKIITPLLDLKNRLTNTTGDNIIIGIFRFLEDTNIRQNIGTLVKNFISLNMNNQAEEQYRIWDIFINILDEMSLIFNGVKITTKKFADFLDIAIKSTEISFIPRGIDEVVVGSIDRIRMSEPKIVFVIGAVEDEFPKIPMVSGIFNNEERSKLTDLGIDIYDNVEQLFMKEKFLSYLAVTIATEKLYVSWPSYNSNGGNRLPSEIVKEITDIFPKIKIYDYYSNSIDEYLWCENTAFEYLASNWHQTSNISESLKKYFYNNGNYSEKLRLLETASKPKNFNFYNTNDSIFNHDIKISASQIEKYYSCRFEYFCNYVLKIKDIKPVKFDFLEYGSFCHYILEKFIKNYIKNFSADNSKFNEKEVLKIMVEYAENKFGGLDDKLDRFRYLFFRTFPMIKLLLDRVIEEFNQSRFKPILCEANVSDIGIISPLIIHHNGKNIQVNGKIDRIDIMNDSENDYFRIIDYKTSKKTFELSEVLYGINMQMLIYIATMCNDTKYNNMVPAGILYMPLIKPTTDDEPNVDIEKNLKKNLCMDGLILDNDSVITGMEKNVEEIFIPISKGKSKSKNKNVLVTISDLQVIIKYVIYMVRSMIADLQKGKINPNPILKANRRHCDYCEYKSICCYEDDNFIKIPKVGNKKVIEKMMDKMSEVEKL